MPLDIPTFAQTQLSLLAAELAAEIAESAALVSLHSPAALQRAGVALTNLGTSNSKALCLSVCLSICLSVCLSGSVGGELRGVKRPGSYKGGCCGLDLSPDVWS